MSYRLHSFPVARVRADCTFTPRRYRNARAAVAGLAIPSVHQHRVPLFPTNGDCAKVCDRCRDLRRGTDRSVGFSEPDWIIFYSEHLFPLRLNCLQHARGGHLTSEELLELGDKVGHQLSGFW